MEINLSTEGGRARTVRKAKRAAQRTLRWMQAKVERAGPWAMLLVMLLLAPLACVLMLQRKHGSVMGSASRFRQLELSAADTVVAIQSHTLLMLGGPHRGGTTLLWRLLGQHPNVSAFSRDPLQQAFTPFLPGGRLAADVDVGMEMEGLYQQSVYPLFGLGSQAGVSGYERQGARKDGFGRFALLPEAHLTEKSQLVTHANRLRLFREWGTHWDLSRPVLLEKSPPNMMWMRFLQAMFSEARFVVVTRHPLAVAMSHKRWPCCGNMQLGTLVEHWIKQHQLMRADAPHVRQFMWLRYEELAEQPERHLQEVCAFAGLPPHTFEDLGTHVKRDSNGKYMQQYREALADPKGAASHAELVNSFEAQIQALKLGYSLRDFEPDG